MPERKAGLDLVRCTALLLVVTFHSFLYNGYYFESQTGFRMLTAGSIRWLSTGCIGLFLMLTGWLKSEHISPAKCWRGLPAVLAAYFLAAVISVPVRHFFLGDRQSFRTWCMRILQFQGVHYGWYVEMYLGLMLLAPFVNRALAQMRKGDHLCLCGVMLVLTALPGLVPILPDYWRNIYPLSYYILGSLVRRLNLKLKPVIGLSIAAALSVCLGAVTVLSTDGALKKAIVWEFPDLWVVLVSFLLFLSLYHVKPGECIGKLLRLGSGGCFGGYLLSHLLDAWCYRIIPQWCSPEHYWKLFLCVTLPVFGVSMLAGYGIERVAGLLTGGRRNHEK